jgi:ribokinase
MRVPLLVVGALNTDLLGIGVPALLNAGELGFGGTLRVAPGGKGRNIAQMIAAFPEADVRMLGKTGKDPYGLWKPPLEALKSAGVSTVAILTDERLMPGIALIPVDQKGKNQIYVLPGANDHFSSDDIESSRNIFEEVRALHGSVVLSLEIPFPTALKVVSIAREMHITLLIDPGGMQNTIDYSPMLQKGISLLKPNVHEARALSGIEVRDFESAKNAASKLRSFGIEHVLITAGADGAYLFGPTVERHIPAPTLQTASEQTDETGCGDQVMAVLSYCLAIGMDMERAASAAIAAGSLQYRRAGVQPLSFDELKPLVE